jgi:hypothetical protein
VRIGGDHPELFGLGAGSSDLILCVRGRFVGLELKTKKGRAEKEQKGWCRKVQMAGGEYLIARTVEEANRLVDHVSRTALTRGEVVYAARRWYLCRMVGNTLEASHWAAMTMEACGRLEP